MSSVNTASILRAAEKRAKLAKPLPAQPSNALEVSLKDYERQQKFRRLINPGITRPNSVGQARASLKILLTLAENLIRDLDNPKFRRFRCANDIIKRNLVEVKGALEYAIELGFEPKVENYDQYYVFNLKYLDDLITGAQILRDYVDGEDEKASREEVASKWKKAEEQAHIHEIKVQFLKDRKMKAVRDTQIEQNPTQGESSGGTAPGKPRQRQSHMMTLADMVARDAERERQQTDRLGDEMSRLKMN
ncbi:hypothetical protein AX16_000332 [Volvariella volvacea WC 439]|nr:hypothetical protein AX16_000332 [Volvariella volvacea WC 439]